MFMNECTGILRPGSQMILYWLTSDEMHFPPLHAELRSSQIAQSAVTIWNE